MEWLADDFLKTDLLLDRSPQRPYLVANPSTPSAVSVVLASVRNNVGYSRKGRYGGCVASFERDRSTRVVAVAPGRQNEKWSRDLPPGGFRAASSTSDHSY